MLGVQVAVRRARRHRRPRRTDRQRRHRLPGRRRPDAADGRPVEDPAMDETQALQAVIVNSYGPAHLQSTQTDQTFDDLINVGNDFDASRSDDYFYMPREAFDNEDVKTGMQLMMSPDGKAARFIVTHEGNAMGPEGIEHVEQFPEAMKIALKETSLAGRQDLHRRRGIQQQGHQGIRRVRSADRGDRRVHPDLPDHAVPHAKSDGRLGDSRHRGLLVRRRVRSVGPGVAAPDRPAPALAGAADHVHHPGGGRFGLQPAADRPGQGGDAAPGCTPASSARSAAPAAW